VSKHRKKKGEILYSKDYKKFCNNTQVSIIEKVIEKTCKKIQFIINLELITINSEKN
jgi:hypothetical protein